MNHSAPHNYKTDPSINDLFDKNQCSLTYMRTDDAIKVILQYGQGYF